MEQIIIDAIDKVKQDPDSFKEDFAEFVNKSPAKIKSKKKKK
jgi:hypothetical protein